MLKKQFEHAEFVDAGNEPTLVAFDPKTSKLVIGEVAGALSRAFKPVVQDFKQAIGDSDALFDGKYVAAKGARAQKQWPIRYDGNENENTISTRTATKTYLQNFLAELNDLPRQLIVGIPSVKDSGWAKQYRSHMSSVLMELGFEAPDFFPEPFAVFQYYRHVEGLIPESSQPLAVLVIDFGGGTIDSCVIETTTEGNSPKEGRPHCHSAFTLLWALGRKLTDGC